MAKKNEFALVKNVNKDGAWGYVLFAAFVGALVYFVQQSEGFGGFLLAILKAIVWPALLMHEILTQMAL